MHFNLNCHTVRSSRWTLPVSMLLLAALVAATVLPLPGQAQEGTTAIGGVQPGLYLLAPSTSGVPPTLSPGLTLHALLQSPNGARWVVSGTPEQATALHAAGRELVVLDADTTGNRYYLADASPPQAARLAATVGDVLYAGSDALLIATTPAREQLLIETLPSQGVAIALLGSATQGDELTAAMPARRAPVPALDPPNSNVASLLPLLTETDLYTLTVQLSGQAPVMVAGAPVTLNTRYTLASRIRSAEEFVYQWYAGLGIPVGYFNWTYGSYSGRNVIAEVRGAVDPSQILLLGGHLDDNSQIPYATAPGADDNATGTAATLLVARILRSYTPAITVRFVHFTGEEQGQWGSRVYANTLRQRGENVIGFINLDMIGWDSNGDRVAEIHTANGPKSNALGTEFLNRNDRYQQGLVFERKTTTASRFSDHSPFWDNNYGAFLTIENFFDDAIPRDRNPDYHNTGDLPAQVNTNYVARIGRVALATVAELARYNIGGTPPTPTPTATATRTPAPLPTPTSTATPVPGTCTNLLGNGDFEFTGGWRFGSTPFPAAYMTTPVYSGARTLRLGIPTSSTNRLAHSSAYQAVTIPASAPAPVILSYAQRAGGGSDGYDYRETLLLNADFSYLARVERNYAAGNDQWTVRQFDLTTYRGRTVVLYFNVYNNGGRTQMWNYMDNVALGSCPPSAAVAQVESDSTWKESTLFPAAVTGVGQLQVGSAQVVLDDAGGATQAVIAVDGQRAGQSIAWQAAADVTWLRLEANQGETPGLLTVAVDGVGLPWGQYHATLHIQDALAAEPGQAITVEYTHDAAFRLYLPAVQQ